MQLSIGYSSCPNDTFIFDALIHNKIDCKGIEFKLHMADVKELNKMAFESKLDITKLSYHAYAYLTDFYVLLNSGSALGNNCGPLLIAKKETAIEDVSSLKIAIPGKYTTANFLLKLAFPDAAHCEEMLFDEIEEAVLTEKTDLGLIIHENRFTYEQKGLKKVIDLGEFWEAQQQAPIPLGGIAIKRSIPNETKFLVSELIKASIAYAFDNPTSSADYVKQHAQEMETAVVKQHIALYVNEYSLDLGPTGKEAILKMYHLAKAKNLIPKIEKSIFL